MPVQPWMLAAKKKRKRYTSKLQGKKQRTTYSSPVVFRPSNAGLRRSGLGQMKVVKLNWSTRTFIPAATIAGVACAAEFSINGAFKPDTILVNARQPLGWDQLVPLFDKYHVTAVRYKAAFWGTSTDHRNVGVVITDRQVASLTNFSMETLIEQGLCQWKPLSTNTAGPNCTTFEGYVDLPKVVGKSYSEYVADDTYGALTSTTPANQIYMYLYAGNADGASAALPITWAFVEYEFTIRFAGSAITPAS